MKLKPRLLIAASFSMLAGYSQNYQAINGSSLFGSLTVHNNPASIVNNPYKWDLTLFGMQAKTTNNMVDVTNYSILSSPSKSLYSFRSGEYKRMAMANANINLLNARIALSREKAIAFGFNFRGYLDFQTSKYNFRDTLGSLGEFMGLNVDNQPMSMSTTSSSWMEIYGTYSQSIIDNSRYRLNGGATVKLMRGISGLEYDLNNAEYSPLIAVNPPAHFISNAIAGMGYSQNFDKIKSANSGFENAYQFLNFTEGGISFDAGIELLIKTQAVTDIYDEDDYYDYRWKFGLSFLDYGLNQYKYGSNSIFLYGVKPGLTDIQLEKKMTNLGPNLSDLDDSLKTIAIQSVQPKGSAYRILNPSRIVLNADYFVRDHWFVNAELSLNTSNLMGKAGGFRYVREMNLASVTPRWETKKYGGYLPMMLTTNGRFWVGAAAKLGPVLFGLHNLGYIFSKKSLLQGGGYLAITLRPSDLMRTKDDIRYNCPEDKKTFLQKLGLR